MPYSSFNFKLPEIYTFRVYLKDGKVLEGKSCLHYDMGNAYIKINDQKIIPSETDSIVANFRAGIPEKKCWLFKIKEGKISAYSKKPDIETTKFDFIKKSDTEYKKFSVANIKDFVKDDPIAFSEIKKYETGRLTTYSMIAVGGAMLLGGFMSLPSNGTDKSFSELPQSKIMIGGLIVAVASWIPHLATKDKKVIAIKLYNRDRE